VRNLGRITGNAEMPIRKSIAEVRIRLTGGAVNAINLSCGYPCRWIYKPYAGSCIFYLL